MTCLKAEKPVQRTLPDNVSVVLVRPRYAANIGASARAASVCKGEATSSVSLLFGHEDTGLTNREISLCDRLVTIRAGEAPAHSTCHTR